LQAQLDPEILDTPARPDTISSKSERPSLPDIHDRPRRRMHPMLAAGLAFGVAAVAFYGTEAFLPREYRPSTFIGGYQTEITEAAKSGELAAQIRYDAQLRGIELRYQDGLSRIQTAGAQWQEQCRAGLLNITNHYQAVMQQANVFAQGVVQLQNGYQQMRNQILSGSLQGEMGLINLVMTVAPFIAIFDGNTARQLMQAAQQDRARLIATFDRMSRGGNTVSVAGWNTNLLRPEALQTMIRCEVPIYQTGVSANPIPVPPNAAPRR